MYPVFDQASDLNLEPCTQSWFFPCCYCWRVVLFWRVSPFSPLFRLFPLHRGTLYSSCICNKSICNSCKGQRQLWKVQCTFCRSGEQQKLPLCSCANPSYFTNLYEFVVCSVVFRRTLYSMRASRTERQFDWHRSMESSSMNGHEQVGDCQQKTRTENRKNESNLLTVSGSCTNPSR